MFFTVHALSDAKSRTALSRFNLAKNMAFDLFDTFTFHTI